MTVKEFKELFKGEMKFFDYATGKTIGEEFKTEKNESLQELEIANIELGIRANSFRPKYSDVDIIKPEYSAYVKVFVDINTKTLKMREAIRTIEMSQYNAWYVRDTENNLLYTNTEYFKDNTEYFKDNGDSAYRANIKDLPINTLNSIVTKIGIVFNKDTSKQSIIFDIINEEEE